MYMFKPGDFKNKKGLVIGAGKSGIACANLLNEKGFSILLTEQQPKEKISERLKNLNQDIMAETGGHTDAVFSCAFAIKCPGLPHSNPLIKALEKHNIPIFSEIETALAFADRPFLIGITGTNGKTTTAMLLGNIMKKHAEASGLDAETAGNIGTPLSDAVRKIRPGSFITAELSSYQLEDSTFIRPEVSAVLNITPDHLEHHGSMEKYIEAKARIMLNQDSSCFCVLNLDDPICRKMAKMTKAKILWFSSLENAGVEKKADACIDGEFLKFRFNGHEYKINPPNLPGRHNMENAMAAGLMAFAAGANAGEIEHSFSVFKPVEHRIEPAGSVNGILFINDSKATNVDSTAVALKAMPAGKKVWLILGGRDKGAPYAPLVPLIREKVKGIFMIGEAAPIISKQLSSLCASYQRETVYEACREIIKLGSNGDIALFSPACSSFDQFKDYEDRGRKFKNFVKGLSNGQI